MLFTLWLACWFWIELMPCSVSLLWSLIGLLMFFCNFLMMCVISVTCLIHCGLLVILLKACRIFFFYGYFLICFLSASRVCFVWVVIYSLIVSILLDTKVILLQCFGGAPNRMWNDSFECEKSFLVLWNNLQGPMKFIVMTSGFFLFLLPFFWF